MSRGDSRNTEIRQRLRICQCLSVLDRPAVDYVAYGDLADLAGAGAGDVGHQQDQCGDVARGSVGADVMTQRFLRRSSR